MKTTTVTLMIVFGGLTVVPNLCGLQRAHSEKVYYGEVTKETAEAITVNVTPCEKAKNLQTISPYKKVGSEPASCPGGKNYVKVAVQEAPEQEIEDKNDQAPKGPDKKDEKNKKQPQKPEEQPKDKTLN